MSVIQDKIDRLRRDCLIIELLEAVLQRDSGIKPDAESLGDLLTYAAVESKVLRKEMSRLVALRDEAPRPGWTYDNPGR